MIILVKSERAAQRLMQSIPRYLAHSLKLKVNPAESRVAPMRECSFLSFTIKRKKIRWTDQAPAQFKHRVKALTGRSWGLSMDYRLHKLGQYIRGWTEYFGIPQYQQPVPELDEWIRRRIRMCCWKTQFQWGHNLYASYVVTKQWRWARTKTRNLTPKRQPLSSSEPTC